MKKLENKNPSFDLGTSGKGKYNLDGTDAKDNIKSHKKKNSVDSDLKAIEQYNRELLNSRPNTKAKKTNHTTSMGFNKLGKDITENSSMPKLSNYNARIEKSKENKYNLSYKK